MTPTWSFHTHSAFCDGEGSLADVVRAGVEAGLADLGFSSHAPLPFHTDWHMPLDKLAAYQDEVHRLRARHGDRINLWCGAELDYIPEESVFAFQREHIFPARFDYFVGSVHFLGQSDPPEAFDATEEAFRRTLDREYGADMRAMTGDYYLRVSLLARLAGIKIIGHLDLIKRWNAGKRYFRGDEPWYVEQVERALIRLAGTGILVELNTAGWRKVLEEPYPSTWILERCRDLKIPVTISADAHTPQQVTWGYGRAEALLDSLGIEPVNPATLLGHGVPNPGRSAVYPTGVA